MQEACEQAEALLKELRISVEALANAQILVDNAKSALAALEKSYGRPHSTDAFPFVDRNMRRAYIAAKQVLLQAVHRRDHAGAGAAELAMQLANMEEEYGARIQSNFTALQRADAWEGEFDGVPRL